MKNKFLKMRQLQLPKLWGSILLAYLAVVAILCLIRLYGPPSDIPYLDKIQHFIAYTIMGLMLGSLLERGQILKGALTCFTYSFIIECLQGLTTYRSFEFYDLVVNLLGALFGCSLAQTLLAGFVPFIDRLLKKQFSFKRS